MSEQIPQPPGSSSTPGRSLSNNQDELLFQGPARVGATGGIIEQNPFSPASKTINARPGSPPQASGRSNRGVELDSFFDPIDMLEKKYPSKLDPNLLDVQSNVGGPNRGDPNANHFMLQQPQRAGHVAREPALNDRNFDDLVAGPRAQLSNNDLYDIRGVQNQKQQQKTKTKQQLRDEYRGIVPVDQLEFFLEVKEHVD